MPMEVIGMQNDQYIDLAVFQVVRSGFGTQDERQQEKDAQTG